jgi:hypothetical protein
MEVAPPRRWPPSRTWLTFLANHVSQIAAVDYFACDHQWRTHLSLDEDSPLSRATQIPNGRPIVAVPHVGGLHHHYERLAA